MSSVFLPKGLSTTESKKLLIKYGSNSFANSNNRWFISILLSQLNNWLIFLLIAASLISYLLGERIDTIVILAIVFLSVILGFYQEYHAEKTAQKLKKLITHKARVLRDTKWEEISSIDIVPGDVVSLRIGDRVCADINLIETHELTIDESVLTGESLPVTKSVDTNKKAYEGTYISSGTGIGIVFATGKNTSIGKTTTSLSIKEPETDFQKQIRRFSSFLSKIVIFMTVIIVLINTALGKGVFDSLLFAVALAVGIAPELLPVIITITLSEGAVKMSRKKVIIKKLVSVEDFGNIDTLCSDKTGTLTEGLFSLSRFENINQKSDDEVFIQSILCSSGFTKDGKTSDAIDHAIWESNERKKIKTILNEYELTDENEFDFTRRMMSVVVKKNGKYLFIVKGAVESILPLCSLAKTQKTYLENRIKEIQKDGFRIIAVGYKPFTKKEGSVKDESNINFSGLLLFSDPIKSTVRKSLLELDNLGVNIKIISGDSEEIVEHTAIEAGIIPTHNSDLLITGVNLEKMDEELFTKTVFEKKLFARVDPEQKRKIVACLNQKGHIVGYLGDGINDAPALRAADVGIAVNSGSDIAKEAADIILLKKDLSILTEGIIEGRKTFANITKYILNTVSANYGNMFTLASSSLFLKFIPLLPKQILLNNFISDFPLLAIASDNVDGNFVRKPKKWNISLIGKFMIYFGLISSFFDLATIVPLIFIWKSSPEIFRTAWFIESSLSEIIVTFSIRTQLPFYKSRASTWLLFLSVVSISLVTLLPFVGIAQEMFSFASLPIGVFLWIFIILTAYFVIVEAVKKYFFQKFSF